MVGSVYGLELANFTHENEPSVTVPIFDGRIEYAVPSCIGTDCVTDVRYNSRTNRIIIKTDREKKYTLRVKNSGNGIKAKIMKIS